MARGRGIHTRIAGESEAVVIDTSADELRPPGLIAHFPIPVARAWDNVHRFCGSSLVFESEEQVDAWCERHAYARGAVEPLDRIRSLATAWYGGYLAPDWKKWTAMQAAELFASVGLEGETWALPPSEATF